MNVLGYSWTSAKFWVILYRWGISCTSVGFFEELGVSQFVYFMTESFDVWWMLPTCSFYFSIAQYYIFYTISLKIHVFILQKFLLPLFAVFSVTKLQSQRKSCSLLKLYWMCTWSRSWQHSHVKISFLTFSSPPPLVPVAIHVQLAWWDCLSLILI